VDDDGGLSSNYLKLCKLSKLISKYFSNKKYHHQLQLTYSTALFDLVVHYKSAIDYGVKNAR
jgi:hypothetical protein